MHPPRLSGSDIYITPPDNEVERYISHIDERIAAANVAYEKHILPKVRAAEEAEARAKEDEKRRLDEVRRKIENL
jgi:hypothetical protein